MSYKKQNPNQTLTFDLAETNLLTYTNMHGMSYAAPITTTIVCWLKQYKLEDRQVASLTRYLRKFDSTLDENFDRPSSYQSKQRRSFIVKPKLQEFINHYQTKLW